MAYRVLVTTPNLAFGELIRQSLKQSGDYQVTISHSSSESILQCQKSPFDAAVLDSDVPDQPFNHLVRILRVFVPQMQLVIIPPENNPTDPRVAGIPAQAYLSKPFNLPDLLRIMDTLQLPREAAPAPLPEADDWQITTRHSLDLPPELAWLQDTSLVVQQLGLLSLEPGIQAALIVRHGGVMAYTGHFAQARVGDLATSALRDWDPESESDLARFGSLQPEGTEHLFYLTRLSGDLVLVLVYDPETPFSQIRSQAGQVVKGIARLSGSYQGITIPGSPARTRQGVAAPGGSVSQVSHPADTPPDIPAQGQRGTDSPYRPEPFPPTSKVTSESPVDSAEFRTASSADLSFEENGPVPLDAVTLFGDIPAPDAPASSDAPERREVPVLRPGGWYKEANGEPFPVANSALVATQVAVKPVVNPAATQVSASPEPRKVELPPTLPPVSAAAPAVMPEVSPEVGRPVVPLAVTPAPARSKISPIERGIQPVDDGLPLRPHPQNRTILEPVSPAISNLSFTCVLLPRLPEYYLAGELAGQLGKWLAQLCVAFGWNLEGLAVRPDYLEWIIRIPPAVSPAKMLRALRRHTSQYIFKAYPALVEANPSGDFWAPGYLIVSGARSLPVQLLREYIDQTHQRQSIEI